MFEPVPSSSLHLPRSQTSKAMTWDLHTDHDRSCPPWTADFRCRADPARTEVLPQLRRNSDNYDNLYVCLFLDGKARCSVPRKDCGPRREGAAVRPPGRSGRGASSKEVAGAAAPSPWLAQRQLADLASSRAWHATLAALQRWRGFSCQPSPAAAPPS